MLFLNFAIGQVMKLLSKHDANFSYWVHDKKITWFYIQYFRLNNMQFEIKTHIPYFLIQFPPLNSFRTFMYCDLWISKFKKEQFPRKLYEEIRYILPQTKLRSNLRLCSPYLISNFCCFLEHLILSDKVKYKNMIKSLRNNA